MSSLSVVCCAPHSSHAAQEAIKSKTAKKAITKAWKLVLVGNGEVGANADEFSRVIQSCLGLTVPSWWRNHLRQEVVIAGHLKAGSQPVYSGWKSVSGKPPKFSGVDSLVIRDKTILAKQGKNSVSIGTDVLLKNTTDPNLSTASISQRPIAANIAQSQVFIAPRCPDLFGSPPCLYALNAKTGAHQWTVDLEDGLVPRFSSGDYSGSYCEITVADKVVAIWTVHDFDLIMQAFDVRTGQEIARFSAHK